MIVVYIKGKRKKEYKKLFLKNIKDQKRVCLDLGLRGDPGLAMLEEVWIILKGY